MFTNQLNLNQVRIFECVYRTKSMTAAAREMHLTQSGVSQHIRALEEFLGMKLFDRINQKVVPTSAGTILYHSCSKSLRELENAFAEIQADKNQLSGAVYIGMPTEFGYNVVIPIAARFAEKYPRVPFHFRLGYNAEMNALLLSGELDFAFIDEYATDNKIKTEPVYDEVLELCAASDVAKKAGASGTQNREYFEKLPYVDFTKDEQILRRWFKHHFAEDSWRLSVRSTIEDSQGIARLVLSGVGAGILPGHLVRKLEREGKKLQVFKGRGSPLKNTISIAQLRDRSHTRAVQAAFDFLSKEIVGLNRSKKA